VEESVHMQRYEKAQLGATAGRVQNVQIDVFHSDMYVYRGHTSSSAPSDDVLDWKAGQATYI